MLGSTTHPSDSETSQHEVMNPKSCAVLSTKKIKRNIRSRSLTTRKLAPSFLNFVFFFKIFSAIDKRERKGYSEERGGSSKEGKTTRKKERQCYKATKQVHRYGSKHEVSSKSPKWLRALQGASAKVQTSHADRKMPECRLIDANRAKK